MDLRALDAKKSEIEVRNISLFYSPKQRKEVKTLRGSLLIDYADCVFTRMLWHQEVRLNGEAHAAKMFPPEKLVQIVYAEAVDSFGLKPKTPDGFTDVSLSKLRFLRALHTVCIKEDGDDVNAVFKAYPKQKQAFEKLRESRGSYMRDLDVNQARLDEKAMKQEQILSGRNDLSQQLRDKKDLLDWLTQHGPDPDFWHVIVCNSDPDGRDEIYHWIASQPSCDAGTAAQIFHHSNAYEALEYQTSALLEHSRLSYRTAKLVADRWAAGQFQTHRFAPNDIYSSASFDEFKRIEEKAKQKFGLPAFKLSDGLFDDEPREQPKTDLYFSDF